MLEKLPQGLQESLDSYNKEWITESVLCKYAGNQNHIPLTEFDKRWARLIMIGVFEILCVDNQLYLGDYSESGLLHELWPIVLTAANMFVMFSFFIP